MIGIVGKLKAKPGKAKELEALLKELSVLAKTHEPGMLSHNFFRSRTDANLFVAVEVFRDQAAYDAHSQTQHYKDHLPVIGALIDRSGGGGIELFDVIV